MSRTRGGKGQRRGRSAAPELEPSPGDADGELVTPSDRRAPAADVEAAKPRWRVWSVRVLVGTFVTALLAWAALNAVHADEPRPLWGTASLPALPDPTANGWQRLFEHPDLFRGVDTFAVHEAVRTLLDAPVDAPPPAGEARSALTTALAAPALAGPWAICAESLAEPSFVDGCPLDFEQRCPVMDLLGCHRLGAGRVIDAAAAERWPAAAAELDALAGQALAWLATARSAVSEVAAFRAAADSMALVAWLARWARGVEASAALDPLRRRLGALKDEQLRYESAAIGEYLLALAGVERMGNGELDTSGGALPRFFFDPGATVAELNRIYEPVHRAAFGLAVPDLPTEPYTARFGWWLRNPLGKLYLDVALPPRGAFIGLGSERAALLRARDEALAALVRAESASDAGPAAAGEPVTER